MYPLTPVDTYSTVPYTHTTSTPHLALFHTYSLIIPITERRVLRMLWSVMRIETTVWSRISNKRLNDWNNRLVHHISTTHVLITHPLTRDWTIETTGRSDILLLQHTHVVITLSLPTLFLTTLSMNPSVGSRYGRWGWFGWKQQGSRSRSGTKVERNGRSST